MNEAVRPGPENPSQTAGLPQLSVIVPTFNERDNVTTLLRRLETALTGVAWEVIFVDDNSPDGTWDVVRNLARSDPRVRCVRRMYRRHFGIERAVRSGHRCRPAARRDAAAGHAGPAAAWRGRSRGRQPLCRRRQRRQF